MALRTKPQITPQQTAETEYVAAPWFLRLCWWVEGRFYLWCRSFDREGVESPEQVNPLWRR